MLRLKNSTRKFIVLFLCALMVCSTQACAACTGIYVGPDVSSDGSSIFARSSDTQKVWGNHITVTPGVDNEPGRFMPVSESGKIKTEIPATTYQYTATPYMDSTKAYNGENVSGACVCTNEHGVAMTMAISAFSNKNALDADPLVEEGLSEDSAIDLVVCQSKTAREGVDVLCGLIDKYGSSESGIAYIGDQNEVWYVEIYTGHQYAAVKLPSDKVSVFGNEFSLEYLSDYNDSVTSKDLFNLSEEKNFAVHGKNNEINLFDTYAGKDTATDYSHMRTWIGHQILAPSQFTADYDNNTRYPLCFDPDKNVSAEDVSQILRNRFEGTKYSPDETGRIDMRVIGTDTALSAHVVQVFPDVPEEMSCVSWVSCGPPVYGVFVPVSNDCINVSDAYGANQPADDKEVFDTNNYPYYIFKEICTRCVGPDNYKIYGEPVKAYWHDAESNMFESMANVMAQAAKINDSNARAIYITSYCNEMQTHAFDDGKQMLNDVVWTQNQNSNTLKIQRNPETHQMTGEKVVIPQMELNLDASHYKNVPKAP